MSVIVWPENCFQSIAALAYIVAASSAKLHRGSMAMPDRAAPAAPNPLTKVRRLAGTRPFSDFFPGAMSVLPCGQSITHGRCPRETTGRTPEAAPPARLRLSGLLSHLCGLVHLFYYSIIALAPAPEDVPVALASKGQGQCNSPRHPGPPA